MSKFTDKFPFSEQIVKKAVMALVAVSGLILVIAWLTGAFERKIPPSALESPETRTIDRKTGEVHEVTKDYIEEAVGTLKAASRTTISAKVLARIENILVVAGDQVEEGSPLIQLDDADLRARLKQAEQELAAATATRKQAETNHARIQRVVNKGGVSRTQFEEAVRHLEVSRAQELRAEQGVQEAKVMLSQATIEAPKSGRIVDRLAEPGDMARPGVPMLILYDAGSLRLEAPVLERLAIKLRPGDKLAAYIDALDREVESTVDEIVPQADAPSRSFLVKASLPRSENLFEGMFGRLRIPSGERRHLCLATDAIHRVGQLDFVEVVTPEGHIEKRFIKVGRLGMPGRVEVLSGLKAGERVLLRSGGDPGGEADEKEDDG